MNQRVQAIIEETRKLSAEERRELFDQLDMLFHEEKSEDTPAAVEAAWMEEVRRRIAARERGEVDTVDFDEVLEKARRQLDGS